MKLNTGFSMTLGVCNANIQGRELPLRGHFLSITSSIISTLWKSIVFRYFIDVRNQRPLDIGRFRGLSISWRNAKTRPVTSSTSPRRNKEKSGRNPPEFLLEAAARPWKGESRVLFSIFNSRIFMVTKKRGGGGRRGGGVRPPWTAPTNYP